MAKVIHALLASFVQSPADVFGGKYGGIDKRQKKCVTLANYFSGWLHTLAAVLATTKKGPQCQLTRECGINCFNQGLATNVTLLFSPL